MADYQGVLADLKVKRAALDRERVELDTAIAALERLSPGSGQQANSATQVKARPASPRAFVGLTIEPDRGRPAAGWPSAAPTGSKAMKTSVKDSAAVNAPRPGMTAKHLRLIEPNAAPPPALRSVAAVLAR